ncbi:cytochrome c-type biogenesis protein CcmE homolog, mitochondrial [Elaeis guineensis]|uniref:Cytochrome c-type biogenesis protein CcmE homolog, mitochondrial n=1 Tax=Elaeis guineensis var. tenera TaxID=51953 RepID=A0A6I9QFA6_ELAGV|nr:cytochrome c-type biogenesis protein CcmE homolog, mitochondrial [Elaeis guineensis]XP_029117583.1 cytochrome c-type biogenesis protein CcmE homolog, mitochondrial [Elaeis guineensis]
MASRILASSLRSRLSPFLRAAALHPHPSPQPLLRPDALLRHLSTAAARRHPYRPRIDVGARARQLQNRRLWTYGLTFSCVAGFVVIVLSNFQDQLVFYVTPTDALTKFAANPSKNRFRLGGLVLEGSVAHPSATSPEIEFVVTDLVTDILVCYEGSLPDLFREGHSAVVEGFIKPIAAAEDAHRLATNGPKVSEKARSGEFFFKATEVLAKHDEKYMPKEVAEALERNKKKIEAEAEAVAIEKRS